MNVEILPTYLQLILMVMGIALVTLIIIRAMFVVYKIRKLQKELQLRVHSGKKLFRLIKKHHLEKKVFVIKSSTSFAFCFGITHPSIYLSTTTLSMMTDTEIEAILLHEKYHLENKDALIMLFASFTAVMFPFFPLLSDLLRHYRIEREIKADSQAITVLRDTRPLLSVLKKMLLAPSFPYIATAAIADTTLESRIRLLVGEKKHSKRFKMLNLVISSLSFFLLAAIIMTPVNATALPSSENNSVVVFLKGTQLNAVCATKNYSSMSPEKESKNINASLLKMSLDNK